MNQEIVDKCRVRLSVGITDFNCPNCGHKYTEKDYGKQLYNNADYLIYKVCLGCRCKIGIVLNYKNDIQVWLKKYENRSE